MTAELETRGTLPIRVAAIIDMGVVVGHDTVWDGDGPERHEVELLDTVTGVNVSTLWNDHDWVSVASREGDDYIGGCCGNMGLAQDITNDIFRSGGWADSNEFLQLGELLRHHDGFETFEPMDDDVFAEALEQWKEVRRALTADPSLQIDPWYPLGIVFNAVEPMLVPDDGDVPQPRSPWITEEHEIVGRLASALERMEWFDFFGGRDDDEHKPQHDANALLLRARTYPLLKRLNTLLDETNLNFSGFALVRGGSDDVLTDNGGSCVYPTRDDAERVVTLWSRWADEERERLASRIDRDKDDEERVAFWQERVAALEVVPCTITPETGLELVR